MKKILTIFSTILLMICLISCNKKVEEDNYDPYSELERTPYIQYISHIDYNPETNINYDFGTLVITGEYKEVVTKSDVPYFNVEEIENLYYDKNYTKPYNGEILDRGDTLYVKFVVDVTLPDNVDEIVDAMNLFTAACGRLFTEETVNFTSKLRFYRYCGVFNGYIVTSFAQGDFAQIVHEEVFGNVVITFPSGYDFLAIKDKKIYYLKEAYNKKLLSEDIIQDIADIHDEIKLH